MTSFNLMINVSHLNIVDLFLSLLNLPTDGDFLVINADTQYHLENGKKKKACLQPIRLHHHNFSGFVTFVYWILRVIVAISDIQSHESFSLMFSCKRKL